MKNEFQGAENEFQGAESEFQGAENEFHTRKRAPSTRKRQNDRILRLKRYGSRNSKQNLANWIKFANFAHLFNSAPHQAPTELHPPERRLKILFYYVIQRSKSVKR